MAGSFSLFSNFDLIAGILNPAHLQQLQKDLMQRVVFTVEAEVKRVTPVRTGTLRRSITGDVVSPTRGIVGSNLVYAPIVHRRNPYLQIGADNAQGAIDQLLAEFGNKAVAG